MEATHPLAHYRLSHGLSQDALGERVGVDGMTISRWERGESLPQKRFWLKIEELTGEPIERILTASIAREVTS